MQPRELRNIPEATQWVSQFLGHTISESDVFHLIKSGKVKTYHVVDLDDLRKYYDSYKGRRELNWKKELGNDLHWALSFDHLGEKDTTKHVHRLHPYKGKFIPQLVEYFLDHHTDEFKKDIYFRHGDIVLDPFLGSGTTLVQANELGIHSIGIDISNFNCMITEVKLFDYDFNELSQEIRKIKEALMNFEVDSHTSLFQKELLSRMADFNQIPRTKVDEAKFIRIYQDLLQKHSIELNGSARNTFLDRWYMKNVRQEINFILGLINQIKDIKNKKVLEVILSRTIRSCRATTHSDLATLKAPKLTPYYCYKHKKICAPIFSIKSWFNRYATDTLKRLRTFSQLKKDVHNTIIPSDSSTVDIFKEVEGQNKKFYEILGKQKIRGIFTSPPYVGQIDYHEQHAYAYELFRFKRRDELEIGPLFKGQGKEAKSSYVNGISQTLLNCKRFLVDDFDIFIVANDKFNLYPSIAQKAGMKIINQFRRPVLNRTERDQSPYSETIFHLKNK